MKYVNWICCHRERAKKISIFPMILVEYITNETNMHGIWVYECMAWYVTFTTIFYIWQFFIMRNGRVDWICSEASNSRSNETKQRDRGTYTHSYLELICDPISMGKNVKREWKEKKLIKSRILLTLIISILFAFRLRMIYIAAAAATTTITNELIFLPLVSIRNLKWVLSFPLPYPSLSLNFQRAPNCRTEGMTTQI